MVQYLTDAERGLRDAIVVHLLSERRTPSGVAFRLCDGLPDDSDSVRDFPNDRVFCEACRLEQRKLMGMWP